MEQKHIDEVPKELCVNIQRAIRDTTDTISEVNTLQEL